MMRRIESCASMNAASHHAPRQLSLLAQAQALALTAV
jgi:hypothetical protein